MTSGTGIRVRTLAALVSALGLVAAACGAATVAGPVATGKHPQLGSHSRHSVRDASASQSETSRAPRLTAPGGLFLRDTYGRAVLLHGVNAVFKRPPYELVDAPGSPWNFTSADAAQMAQLGFNVVRLGIIWAGLEPGTSGSNNPSICSPGPPGDPHQYDPAVFDSYISGVEDTVDLLGRYHIYTILDMHQDVFDSNFGGEGAPLWAQCSGLLPAGPAPGRWSNAYREPSLGLAFSHFWNNDVTGDLQGEFDRMWGLVAARFRGNPWIAGYDPFNEPFSTSLLRDEHQQIDAMLECFYTGTRTPGVPDRGDAPLSCPPGDPPEGVVPTILANDPHHLIFYEPDIFTKHDHPNFVGPMSFPNLVFNFHDYCTFRSGVTGDPTDVNACTAEEERTLDLRMAERPTLGSVYQPNGPPAFMSEFGATADRELLARLTTFADEDLLGWTYWSWKYYGDPTGSGHEALVSPTGQLAPTAAVLSRAYPQTVAGTPVSFSFDPNSAVFHLDFVPNQTIRAPTQVFVPVSTHYPGGYCAVASGARIVSKPDVPHLLLRNEVGARNALVTVTPGRCSSSH